MKIYDGRDMILGRLAAIIAKDALLGEEIKVVNAEKVVISGRKTNTFAHEKEKRAKKGYPLKSAKLSRLPERYVRRTIRGMLPWKQTRGKEAFKRVMCYKGIPQEYTDKQLIKVDKAAVSKLPTLNYMTVEELCNRLK